MQEEEGEGRQGGPVADVFSTDLSGIEQIRFDGARFEYPLQRRVTRAQHHVAFQPRVS
jgi:hypothetical protein